MLKNQFRSFHATQHHTASTKKSFSYSLRFGFSIILCFIECFLKQKHKVILNCDVFKILRLYKTNIHFVALNVILITFYVIPLRLFIEFYKVLSTVM